MTTARKSVSDSQRSSTTRCQSSKVSGSILRRAILFAIVAGVLLSALTHANSRQAAQRPESPFVGSWIADLTRSRLDPKAPFKGASLEIAVAGETVTLTSELVNESGQKQRGAETFLTDGTETPGTLTPGISHVARWVGPSVLATIANKGGNTVFLITYQVSADGKTLTARSSGLVEQVVVFTRK